MTDIKFAPDYGYSPASPFWLVWREDGHYPIFKHPNKDSAEAEAARIASICPGEAIHVLGVIATVQTSPDIIGKRFDPYKTPPAPVPDDPAPDPEFAEVDEAPKHVAGTLREDLDDERPF